MRWLDGITDLMDPRPLSLLQRGLAPRSKGKARAELRPARRWNSAFRWAYLSFSALPFASFLFSAICKASSDNHFAFFHFLFLEMVLIPASCTVS